MSKKVCLGGDFEAVYGILQLTSWLSHCGGERKDLALRAVSVHFLS